MLVLRRIEEIQGEKFHPIYEESNRENIPFFFPDCRDEQEGLKKVEEGFLSYLREDFFPRGAVCLIETEGECWVSAARLYEIGEGKYFLEALETRPDCRGRGFGYRLLTHMTEHLRIHGEIEIRTNVASDNQSSLKVHEKAGFLRSGMPAWNPLLEEEEEGCVEMLYRSQGEAEKSDFPI